MTDIIFYIKASNMECKVTNEVKTSVFQREDYFLSSIWNVFRIRLSSSLMIDQLTT